MSEPTDQQLPPEAHDGIDAASTTEARVQESEQTPALARAADGGPPPTDAPAPDTAPELAGTGAGDPLAGVRTTAEDVEQSVQGDEGPGHPGVRRST